MKLTGIKVLDLSRFLPGPHLAMMMADHGAEVIKIEQPGTGDPLRKFGTMTESGDSLVWLQESRNKRCVTLDLKSPRGKAMLEEMVQKADVVVENFRTGTLEKWGIGYDVLSEINPKLIMVRITGFGQTGPNSHRPAYDFMIQAMGGIMSVTGEPDGSPMKVGVGIADVMCGMYAAVGILAAILHREQGGKGQHIDLALLDSQAAWLINSGLNYLTSRQDQHRLGNAHPNVVPYQVFQTSDSFFVLAVGNEIQFQKFCEFAGAPELSEDSRFKSNASRVKNRKILAEMINKLTQCNSTQYWLEGLEKLQVPCGPVNTIKEVFDDPQIKHREMEISLPHSVSGKGYVSLIGSPVKMSATPVSYRNAPPTLGQHTNEILAEILGMDEEEYRDLAKKGVV